MAVKPESFIVHKPCLNADAPVIFDSPHSGRDLPAHFRYSCRKEKLMEFGDLHIEKLLRDVPKAGAPVLEGKIHRAVIDLNRHDYEIDPKEIKGYWYAPHRLTPYTRDGFGLIPTRLGTPHNLTRIFNESARPSAAEVRKRLTVYYNPYHKQLRELIDKAVARHGFSIHMDIHSFRRLNEEAGKAPDIILGNLDGRSCGKAISDFVADFFKKEGLRVVFNKPFKGAAIVARHSDPAKERHSLQIEIARDLYMNMKTLEFDPVKGSRMRDVMTRLSFSLKRFAVDYAASLTDSPSPKTSPHASNRASSNARRPT